MRGQFIAVCMNCGKARKYICDDISCRCTDWNEDEIYTSNYNDSFESILAEFTVDEND